MFFFDIWYIFLVILPGMAISGLASMYLRYAFSKYSQVGTYNGMTGAQAAQRLLDNAGIHDVRIVPTHGYLSDHYNPVSKELALSPEVYGSNSVAARSRMPRSWPCHSTSCRLHSIVDSFGDRSRRWNWIFARNLRDGVWPDVPSSMACTDRCSSFLITFDFPIDYASSRMGCKRSREDSSRRIANRYA